mmetsp:Transcript_23708/g.66956  ORF Transcript_23708/g.66956 Transcript_23708/m.66956 type:complete len:217 (-) Transcript_23708:239-889(-)|eukprot:CAMPEP_0119560232 /NCGR_PEP_ID=MMETSP1352-20130426/14349_1 /TAXON_ID=265584 /ORGANISM="Stauroneis constricta, Strain CCMP1120" /LENGTH=216 /DNA_ID=CAMNT_0007608167 /DNA_START=111 /DNA_END=761 /DNA_ORIENTATION=-
MSATAATSTTNARKGEADAKILKDLDTMSEKMDLCEAMLNPGAGRPAPSVKTSEAMLAVVGFLEACAPRMVQLVEVAAQGALSEDVLIKCLEYNDRLQKILEDVDTKAVTETAATTTVASAAGDVTSQFDDLLLNSEENGNKPPAAAMMGKTTGEEPVDPFAPSSKPAAMPSAAAAAGGTPGVEPSKSADDFDSFFQQRTGGAAGDANGNGGNLFS